jgi:hypothetical protein
MCLALKPRWHDQNFASQIVFNMETLKDYLQAHSVLDRVDSIQG